MAGVWVALEDIDADNGPLIYYPGSHKLPIFTNEHIGRNPYTQGPNPYNNYPLYEKAWEAIVDGLQLKPLYFHANKGQALIWSANLLHGGAAQRDMKRTRYSQVTHYYFERCCYYTPLESVPFLGMIHYRNIRDVTTGEPVANQVNGVQVPKSEDSSAGLTQQVRRWLRPTKNSRKESKAAAAMPPGFDPDAYLKANPDVAAAGRDPLKHWLEFGQREGRPIR